MTNEHVVNGADLLRIKWQERLLDARVIRKDANNDIAILKAEGVFPCLPLGGDLTIRPGEDVFTIGFPMSHVLGEAPKTTLGSVTSLSGIEDDPRAFQVSVQIQPGNSGGPLVMKSTGNVIGVTSSTFNTAKAIDDGRPVPQNVNYAMKVSYIRPLLATIPGLATKLSPENKAIGNWSEIQQTVEEAVGMVVIYKAEEERESMVEQSREPSPPPPPAPTPSATGPWIFPDSSQRRLTVADLRGLSTEALWRARNEIYARNGLVFSTPRGRAFAASLGSSYHGTDPNQERVSARFNPIERANVDLIKRHE